MVTFIIEVMTMTKPTREQKIDVLATWYRGALCCLAPDSDRFPIMNHIIKDSVGISGLEEVKRRAWKCNNPDDV